MIFKLNEAFHEDGKDYKGVRIITLNADYPGHKIVLDFDNFEAAAKHFDNVYNNSTHEEYAEQVLYPILCAAQNKEFDYITADNWVVIEQDATGIFDNTDSIGDNMIINLNESSASTDLKKTLLNVSNFINKSYGNNTSAEVNDAGDTISFGDITKSKALDKVRVIVKNEPVYYIEGPLGDTEDKAMTLDSLQNKLIDVITTIMRDSRNLDESIKESNAGNLYAITNTADADPMSEDFWGWDTEYDVGYELMTLSNLIPDADIFDTLEAAEDRADDVLSSIFEDEVFIVGFEAYYPYSPTGFVKRITR